MQSAIKQSLKARLPQLNEMTDFNKFIAQPFKGQKFIAHCYEGEKPLLKDVLRKGEDALVLIGPEGDFSEEEVQKAIENGFTPISLGKSRLRTETAAREVRRAAPRRILDVATGTGDLAIEMARRIAGVHYRGRRHA